MGKALVIEGADFSQVSCGKISTATNITNLFTAWEDGSFGINTTGAVSKSTSSMFVRCSVDISQYAGKTLQIMAFKWTSSAGGETSYGHAFLSTTLNTGASISYYRCPKNDKSSAVGSGYTEQIMLEVPTNAKTLDVTYFSDSKLQEIGGEQFSCYVLD